MRPLVRAGEGSMSGGMIDDPTTKAALRATVLARRAALSPSDRAAAVVRAATHALSALGTRPGPIAVFLPIRDEIDTAPLIAALVARGDRLCLPVVQGRGLPLLFRAWSPGDRLEARAFGLSEPADDSPEVVPNQLVVPLAVFDARCHRIGYGAGHYDRTLGALGKPHAVGFAFAVQEVAHVPDGPHDVPLDAIATENGVVSPSS